MAYKCGKCLDEVKMVRLSDDRTKWLCDKCYFDKPIKCVKINSNGYNQTKTSSRQHSEK